jgi:hypothetical protein
MFHTEFSLLTILFVLIFFSTDWTFLTEFLPLLPGRFCLVGFYFSSWSVSTGYIFPTDGIFRAVFFFLLTKPEPGVTLATFLDGSDGGVSAQDGGRPTVYLVPQTLYKIHPDFDHLLLAILAKVMEERKGKEGR